MGDISPRLVVLSALQWQDVPSGASQQAVFFHGPCICSRIQELAPSPISIHDGLC